MFIKCHTLCLRNTLFLIPESRISALLFSIFTYKYPH